MHIAQIWWYTYSLSVCLYAAKYVQCALLLKDKDRRSIWDELERERERGREPKVDFRVVAAAAAAAERSGGQLLKAAARKWEKLRELSGSSPAATVLLPIFRVLGKLPCNMWPLSQGKMRN